MKYDLNPIRSFKPKSSGRRHSSTGNQLFDIGLFENLFKITTYNLKYNSLQFELQLSEKAILTTTNHLKWLYVIIETVWNSVLPLLNISKLKKNLFIEANYQWNNIFVRWWKNGLIRLVWLGKDRYKHISQ